MGFEKTARIIEVEQGKNLEFIVLFDMNNSRTAYLVMSCFDIQNILSRLTNKKIVLAPMLEDVKRILTGKTITIAIS